MSSPSPRDSFEVCIICALPLEANAVKALFEEDDGGVGSVGKAAGDTNSYSTGKIGDQNVVLVHMHDMGKVAAATVSENVKKSFEKIRLALVVGICGGVPGDGPDGVMLGDVIVGKHVVHYDFGRQYEIGFVMKDGPEDGLGRQVPEIRGFIRKLEAGKEALGERLAKLLTPVLQSWSPEKLNSLEDILYPSEYWHIHQTKRNENCVGDKCRERQQICQVALKASCEELGCERDDIKRSSKPRPIPSIFFGSVASGDKVMRSATIRDKIAQREDVIGFDMEAAGVWDYLPCILVKGVCDYSDSHKNKDWQEYAAVSAAAFTKALLEQWTQSDQPSAEPEKGRGGGVSFNNVNSRVGNQAHTLTFGNNTTFTF